MVIVENDALENFKREQLKRESAYDRALAGRTEPNDILLLSSCGMLPGSIDPNEKGRLALRARRLREAGTDDEYRTARDDNNNALVESARVIADCDDEERRLQAALTKLDFCHPADVFL